MLEGLNGAVVALTKFVSVITWVITTIQGMMLSIPHAKEQTWYTKIAEDIVFGNHGRGKPGDDGVPRDYRPESLHVMNAPPEPGDIGAKTPPVHNTTIGKIEIKVDGDADPQRVASLVVTKLMDAARNPTKSSGGPPEFSGQAGY